jgi:hypothetical protein
MDPVGALRRERAELLTLCRHLSDADWQTQSAAVVRPDGSVQLGSPAGTAAQIDGAALEFPEWGTQRASWRARCVTVGGDTDYGARLLDAVNVV